MSGAGSALNRVLRRFGVQVVRRPRPGAPTPCAHEAATRRARLLRHHRVDLVVDVGAANGEYASELRAHGYGGEIISCEPLAEPFRRLSRRAASDPAWTARNTAIGRDASPLTINVSANGYSSSALPVLELTTEAEPACAYVGTETVPCTTVDALLEGHPARRPFVKVDVQGFEWAVLDGMTETAGRVVGLQLEMSLAPLYRGQRLFADDLERVGSLGFELHAVETVFWDPATGRLLQLDGIFFRPG